MLRNIGANWMLTVLAVLVAYVLMPFNIRTLGQEHYGTWILIVSITGYLSLLVLGAPMASVRYIAKYATEKRQQELNEAVGTLVGVYLAMGIVALAIGAVLFTVFAALWEVPQALVAEARFTFVLVVLHVSGGFLLQLPYGCMVAHRDFVVRNLIMGSGLILRLILTLAVLTLRPTVSSLAIVQLLILALELAVAWTTVYRLYPELELSLKYFNWAMLKRILSFSMYVMVLLAGTRLAFQTDSLVIGAFLSLGSIPFYTAANTLVVHLTDFVVAISAVVMPTATKLQSEGDLSGLRDIFLRWSKITYSLALAPGAFLVVLGPRFVGWWIEPSFENTAGPVLQVLMLSFLAFLPLRGVALPIMMGLGKPAQPTIAFLIAGVLNLGISIALAKPLGLVGVALGTAIPNVLFACALTIMTCREISLPIGQYLLYVMPKASLGALPLFAFLAWLQQRFALTTFIGLFSAGISMLLLYAVLWVVFVYHGDRYVDLWSILRKRML